MPCWRLERTRKTLAMLQRTCTTTRARIHVCKSLRRDNSARAFEWCSSREETPSGCGDMAGRGFGLPSTLPLGTPRPTQRSPKAVSARTIIVDRVGGRRRSGLPRKASSRGCIRTWLLCSSTLFLPYPDTHFQSSKLFRHVFGLTLAFADHP